MKHRVIFRPEARDEALEAAAYIADLASPECALAWYQDLVALIDTLAHYPQRGALAREDAAFPDVTLRQVLFKSHRVIYTIRDEEVQVLHLRHAARLDLEEL